MKYKFNYFPILKMNFWSPFSSLLLEFSTKLEKIWIFGPRIENEFPLLKKKKWISLISYFKGNKKYDLSSPLSSILDRFKPLPPQKKSVLVHIILNWSFPLKTKILHWSFILFSKKSDFLIEMCLYYDL